MGAAPSQSASGLGEAYDELPKRFARLVRGPYGARLYLFGSRSRGNPRTDSDFDLVAVADVFGEQPSLFGGPGHRELWREAGGYGVPVDFLCFAHSEFREATHDGFGAVGWAKKQGELRRITTTKRKRPTVKN